MNPLNKILLGVGAAFALVIIVAFVWLSLANAHLKTQLAQMQANDTACHMANDDFAVKQALQNKAVRRLQAASIARERRAQAAAYQAQKTLRAAYLAAEQLRVRKLPQGDDCKIAAGLLDQFIAAQK